MSISRASTASCGNARRLHEAGASAFIALSSGIHMLLRTSFLLLIASVSAALAGPITLQGSPLIAQVMTSCDSVQTKAATKLGINRNTLHKKLKEYGLDGEE